MANIQGLDKLLAKLTALGGNANQSLVKAVRQGTHLVQAAAKADAPVGDGQLRGSIQADVKVDGDRVEGSVSTNAEHAVYNEFGTGPVGQASDKSALPAEIVARLHYRQDGWWIHESQIDASTAEKYHFKRIETSDGVFYYTEGQPARPFMYPALEKNRKKVLDLTKQSLRRDIQRLGGK